MSCYSVAEEITSICAGIRTADHRSAGTLRARAEKEPATGRTSAVKAVHLYWARYDADAPGREHIPTRVRPSLFQRIDAGQEEAWRAVVARRGRV
jgi:hypothetical protein